MLYKFLVTRPKGQAIENLIITHKVSDIFNQSC